MPLAPSTEAEQSGRGRLTLTSSAASMHYDTPTMLLKVRSPTPEPKNPNALRGVVFVGFRVGFRKGTVLLQADVYGCCLRMG